GQTLRQKESELRVAHSNQIPCRAVQAIQDLDRWILQVRLGGPRVRFVLEQVQQYVVDPAVDEERRRDFHPRRRHDQGLELNIEIRPALGKGVLGQKGTNEY